MNSRPSAIIALLTAGVSAIKQSGPRPVPNDALFPFLVVTEPYEKELENIVGKSGLTSTLIQVDIWSKDYEEAWVVREACKTALLGTTGTFIGQTISSCNYQNGHELYDGHRELHQLISRYKIWWQSSA